MDKLFFGGIIEKTNQKGGKYYLLNVWCPSSYNGIEGQKDNFYYILDEEAFTILKSVEENSDISDIAEIKLTANSTKLILNNKEYAQR